MVKKLKAGSDRLRAVYWSAVGDVIHDAHSLQPVLAVKDMGSGILSGTAFPPYIFITVCCFCLCIFEMDYSNFVSRGTIIRLIFAILYLIICTVILGTKR